MSPTPPARYAIGIDLGTSHSALAYAPLGGDAPAIALLPIAQRQNAAEVQAQTLLPSMRYQAGVGELGQAWQQPWPPLGADEAAPAVLGHWARSLGAATPARLVSSAKSWLSHAGVDRSAPILPWGAPAEVAKISPLQASAAYLAHLKTAWDAAHPDAPLIAQSLVLTVPASFDEGARTLTLQAAELAGLPPVQLLEEPQAAFHDWLTLQAQQWQAQLADSALALVIDVGGGTTDLTLIAIDHGHSPPRLRRCAVGEHLMLGGDNMDLALAHALEPALAAPEPRLPPARFAQLVQRCRQAKEQLLAPNAPDQVEVTLLGSGSRLLAHTRSTPLTRAMVQALVLDGFFPLAQPDARPASRQQALRHLGLPYPQDAAITHHIAAFLARHREHGWPDTVLLNGGVFHGQALAERLCSQLAQWRGQAVRLLSNPHPDWAVARGAAAHAWSRQTALSEQDSAQDSTQNLERNTAQTLTTSARTAIKNRVPHIESSAARSYWLVLRGRGKSAAKVPQPPQALCLLARGTAQGARVQLQGRRFSLTLGQPVRFDLLARSSGHAQAGEILPITGEGWTELPPLATVLPAPEGQGSAPIAVYLQACLGETGTLELRCISAENHVQDSSQDSAPSWLLPFAVRHTEAATAGIDGKNAPDSIAADADTTSLRARFDSKNTPPLTVALAQIARIFGPQAQSVTPKDVRQLRAQLDKTLGPREQWDVTVLRPLFDALLTDAKRRRRSAEHERVWLNLAGWCLRPGLGAQLDAWRVSQVWALYEQGLGHSGEGANWTQWWVFWRRIAAGLDEAQQMQLLEDVAGCMQKTVQRSAPARWGSYDDMLRLFAAMEAIPWAYRQEMGQWMLTRLERRDEPAHTWWAIGRLATRTPLAANAHQVMPPEAAQEFLDATLAQDWRKNEVAMFAAVHIARMTGDRALDFSDAVREIVLAQLHAANAPARWIEQVASVHAQSDEDRSRALGDSLPPGLVLLG